MSISILIATYGAPEWSELAWSRAYPSAIEQGACEVLVRHEPDGTVASARNRLAEMAVGDFVLWCDADDELCPGYVDAMQAAFEAWDVTCYRGNMEAGRKVYPNAIFAPAMPKMNGGGVTSFHIPNAGKWPDANTCCIGTMYPRALFLEIGGFRELTSLEDFDLALRAVKAGARIVHVPDAVYCAHVSPGSRNSDQSVYAQLRAEHAEVWAR